MPLVTLALWFVIVAALIGIRHDVPVIDDWTYAWTVEHLLRTGSFAVLDWSSAYPLSQALWGAAWSALLGFSFTTLSLSTIVLAAVGCGALYLLLRELDASTGVALVGALTLAANPLYVFLSSSFMTDVPFIAFTTLALLCYVRASTRGERRWLWWGAVWAFAAFLTRQVGIITPMAALPLLLVPLAGRQPHQPFTRVHVAVSLIATWSAMLVTWIAMREQLGVTSVMQRWASNVYAGPAEYHLLVPYFLGIISIFLLPTLLADVAARGVRLRLIAGVLVGSAVLLLLVHGEIPLPLRYDQTWSWYELGSSRALINGELPERAPIWIDAPGRAVGLLALTLLLGVIIGRGDWRARLAAWRQAPHHLWARAPIVIFIVAYLALVNLLWMYNDRYYLALVPPLVALILGGQATTVGRLRLATSALLMFAVIALVGTRDAQRFNQAVRDASQTLIDTGVAPSDIDAGYAWNGWTLYAHPANLAPGLTPWTDVPFITSDRLTEYVISKTRDMKGYEVEREVSWPGPPWPGANRLFVLRQRDARAAPRVNATTLDTQ